MSNICKEKTEGGEVLYIRVCACENNKMDEQTEEYLAICFKIKINNKNKIGIQIYNAIVNFFCLHLDASPTSSAAVSL